MIGSMTGSRMIELVAAVLLLVAGVIVYRRKPADGNSYGNQGAVILLVIAVIVGIHALGGLDYHPSQAEADALNARGAR
jgi:uncharacterized membrane protein